MIKKIINKSLAVFDITKTKILRPVIEYCLRNELLKEKKILSKNKCGQATKL